jgi:glycosyltransferase involved in cell wall biosynthesis
MSKNRLTVLSANSSAVGGGAEKVTLSLHLEYLARGIDSWLALGCNNWGGAQALQIPNDDRRSWWARAVLGPAAKISDRSVRRTDAAWMASRGLRILAEPDRYARVLRGFEDFDFPETAHLAELPPTPPDILHLHNLHGSYFDVRQLPALSAACPTILTMHDAWLLTGHCAYPLDCEHWRTGCGECPYLDIFVPIPRDQSAANCRVKREAIAASHLGLATPSRWLMHMAEEAGVIGPNLEPRVIPNGVDTKVFRPGDKAAARDALGLPHNRKVVLFAGRGIKDSPFKGIATLTEALDIVASSPEAHDMLFLALGSDAPPTLLNRTELRYVPYTKDSAEVARYYQAADLYVHPARAENLPLAVIEAMACRTPVVASDVGGIPEIVVNGESGLLFEPGNAPALAQAVVEMLGDEARLAQFAEVSARRVAEHFTLDRQVEAYLDWYAELLESRDADPPQ